MSTSAEFVATDQPVYWFSLLERAVYQGDHQAAARAQRELARLGVRVEYGQARHRCQKGGDRGRP